MENTKQMAVIDADFFIKLTEYIPDKGEVFCQMMNDLEIQPIMHKYVADVELKRNNCLKELVNKGIVKIVDYDVYIDRNADENYQDYFRGAYEKMNQFEFPETEDIYTYHEKDENLGEIRSIYLAKQMKCMYFMSDDSRARSFAKNVFSSKNKLQTMSIYDALKQCHMRKTSITLKQLNPILHAVFRNRQEKLKELQIIYAADDI